MTACLVAALEQMAQGAVDAKIAEAGRHDEIGAVGRAVEGIRGMVARKALEEAERKQLSVSEARRGAAGCEHVPEASLEQRVRVALSCIGVRGTRTGPAAAAAETS